MEGIFGNEHPLDAYMPHIENIFEDFAIDEEIPRLKTFPDPNDFFRCYVAPNKPCVIEGGCAEWPAVKKWTNDYLKTLDIDVTVASSPDGWADSIKDDKFCLPMETTMKLSEFVKKLEDPDEDEVMYIQKQNSNLVSELSELEKDTPPNLIKWAKKVFNTSHDATNFWMGDQRAVTSMHKDHYENIYCVVRGQKTFTLCPPYTCMRMPHQTCDNYTYQRDPEGEWSLKRTKGKTIWIPGEPDDWNTIKTMEVVVNQGDVLYLPSLWYHQVEQSHETIAVNYWFDMRFDSKYCYFKLAEMLNPVLKPLLDNFKCDALDMPDDSSDEDLSIWATKEENDSESGSITEK